MIIPLKLQEAIACELEGFPLSILSKTVSGVSAGYRNMTGFVSGEDQVKAYAAYRMPATYAALLSVLGRLKEKVPEFFPVSLLDAGAGPGTTVWAATDVFDSLKVFNLYEKENAMAIMGKRMAEYLSAGDFSIRWINADITGNTHLEKGDLVTASYVLNELKETERESFIEKLWENTGDILIILEPGTPEGYRRIMHARKTLLNLGAHMVIPCPHEEECRAGKNDWCHFSVRVERPGFLRQVKGAVLPYEDEKFSYIVMSKQKKTSESRGVVIRHPQVRKGHIITDICFKDGIMRKTFSKKDGEAYKRAGKLSWGDEICQTPPCDGDKTPPCGGVSI